MRQQTLTTQKKPKQVKITTQVALSQHTVQSDRPALCLRVQNQDHKPAETNTKSALGVVCTACMRSIMPAWLLSYAAQAPAPPQPISACARGFLPAQGWHRSTASHWRPSLPNYSIPAPPHAHIMACRGALQRRRHTGEPLLFLRLRPQRLCMQHHGLQRRLRCRVHAAGQHLPEEQNPSVS